ncbi:hypothetical protein FJ936_09125 [Mesorhizobium sp. B2-4-13]|uniref:hypothetical protein n=1 Tax=Mesorhizobium sp. B2-4-13 TaxID=2589936 RepID=UPI0011503A84|nr:hypothetical protein [Mesorhizobium sp. B2-4-13]TPK85690.1 hypothetical protein FJ936_09125 [Mesorhizobium sp. B2-4-13]
MSGDIEAALEVFNRKERYWVVRNALGEQQQPLRLANSFRDKIGAAIDRKIDEDAWWAMDFHIDWLLGALLYRQHGLGSFGHNPTISDVEADPEYAIQGSQQDFDFLIAFGKTIVMVEAKATGGWDRKQYRSKCKRLTALQDPAFATGDLDLFFVLLSPSPPPADLVGMLPACIQQRHAALWFDNPERDFISIGRGSITDKNRWVMGKRKKPRMPAQ